MKNLENKNILNVEKNNKKQSVFDNSEVVLNILYNTSFVLSCNNASNKE